MILQVSFQASPQSCPTLQTPLEPTFPSLSARAHSSAASLIEAAVSAHGRKFRVQMVSMNSVTEPSVTTKCLYHVDSSPVGNKNEVRIRFSVPAANVSTWVRLVDDGVCAIDIFHREGFFRDMATYQQIVRAADKLLTTCLRSGNQGATSQGGYIRDMGKRPIITEPLLIAMS